MKDLNRIILNGQGGAVLVISLLILLVLTILAISTMSTSNFELIMATNVQSQSISLANAEIAVGEGEAQVKAKYSPGPMTSGTNAINPNASTSHTVGIYQYDTVTELTNGFGPDNGNPTTFDWGGADGFATGPSGNKYVIEYMGRHSMSGSSVAGGVNTSSNSRFIYRLSGQGTSSRGGERLVQTLFLTE